MHNTPYAFMCENEHLQQHLFPSMSALVVVPASTVRQSSHTFDFTEWSQIYKTVAIHIDQPRLKGAAEIGLSQ